MNLNRNQKIAVAVGMAMILLSFLFPFWTIENIWGSHTSALDSMVGPSFILNPPVELDGKYEGKTSRINYRQLLAQTFIISILTVGAVCLLDRRTVT